MSETNRPLHRSGYSMPLQRLLNSLNMPVVPGPYQVSREVYVSKPQNDDVKSFTTKSEHGATAECDMNSTVGIFPTHMNYGGASAHNFFKVSQPIELSRLFFHGPWAVPKAQLVEYKVDIRIYQGIWPDDGALLVSSQVRRHLVKSEELIEVDIENPFYCQAGVWYTIEFTLDGPETLRIQSTPKDRESVFTLGYGSVDFEFSCGSRQMPKMEFWMLTPIEHRMATEQWIQNDLRIMRQRRVNIYAVIFEKLSSAFI